MITSLTFVVLSMSTTASASYSWAYDPKWPAAPFSRYLDPTNQSRFTGIAFNVSSNETTVIYRGKNASYLPLTTFDYDGNVVRRWGAGDMVYAHDLRIDGNTFWLMDMGERTVKQIDGATGSILTKLGVPGVLGRSASPLQFR